MRHGEGSGAVSEHGGDKPDGEETGSTRNRPGTGEGEGGTEQVRADQRDGDDTPPVGGGR